MQKEYEEGLDKLRAIVKEKVEAARLEGFNDAKEQAAKLFEPLCAGETDCSVFNDGDTSASHDCQECYADYKYAQRIRSMQPEAKR